MSDAKVYGLRSSRPAVIRAAPDLNAAVQAAIDAEATKIRSEYADRIAMAQNAARAANERALAAQAETTRERHARLAAEAMMQTECQARERAETSVQAAHEALSRAEARAITAEALLTAERAKPPIQAEPKVIYVDKPIMPAASAPAPIPEYTISVAKRDEFGKVKTLDVKVKR